MMKLLFYERPNGSKTVKNYTLSTFTPILYLSCHDYVPDADQNSSKKQYNFLK